MKQLTKRNKTLWGLFATFCLVLTAAVLLLLIPARNTAKAETEAIGTDKITWATTFEDNFDTQTVSDGWYVYKGADTTKNLERDLPQNETGGYGIFGQKSEDNYYFSSPTENFTSGSITDDNRRTILQLHTGATAAQSDYMIEFDFNTPLNRSSMWFRWSFRCNSSYDNTTSYLEFNPTNIKLVNKLGATAKGTKTYNIAFDKDTWYKFKITAIKDNICVYIDGTKVIDYTYTAEEYETLNKGYILTRMVAGTAYSTINLDNFKLSHPAVAVNAENFQLSCEDFSNPEKVSIGDNNPIFNPAYDASGNYVSFTGGGTVLSKQIATDAVIDFAVPNYTTNAEQVGVIVRGYHTYGMGSGGNNERPYANIRGWLLRYNKNNLIGLYYYNNAPAQSGIAANAWNGYSTLLKSYTHSAGLQNAKFRAVLSGSLLTLYERSSAAEGANGTKVLEYDLAAAYRSGRTFANTYSAGQYMSAGQIGIFNWASTVTSHMELQVNATKTGDTANATAYLAQVKTTSDEDITLNGVNLGSDLNGYVSLPFITPYTLGAIPGYQYKVKADGEELDVTQNVDGTYSFNFLPKISFQTTPTQLLEIETEKIPYTVSFEDEDGNALAGYETLTKYYGDTLTLTSPTKAQTAQYTYTFDKWLIKDTETAFDPNSDTVTGNMTLVATFTQTTRSYNVSLTPCTNGTVTLDPAAGAIAYGTKVTVTIAPSDHYELNTAKISYAVGSGTPTEEELTKEDGEYSFTVKGATTLTVTFKKIVCKVEFLDEDDSPFENIDDQSIDHGAKATEPADPTKAATAQYTYTFLGWFESDEATEAFDFDNAIESNLTLKARYSKTLNYYTVSVASNIQRGTVSFTANDDPVDGKYAYGTTITVTVTKEYPECAIGAITVNGQSIGTESGITFTVKGNSVISASITDANERTVTTAECENGSIDIGEDSPFVTRIGETITVTVTPDEGYELDKLTVTVGGVPKNITVTGNTGSFVVEGDSTINATFKAKTYTVTFVDEAGNPVAAAQTVSHGDKATKPDDPTKETTAEYTYAFDNWYVNDSVFKFTATTVKSNLTIVAKFTATKRSYSVIVSDQIENGSLSLSESGSLEYGTVVTITATPDADYELDKITLNGTTLKKTSGAYIFTVTTNVTVSAVFRNPNMRTIEIFETQNGSVSIKVNGNSAEAGVHQKEDSVEIRVTPAIGYKLVSLVIQDDTDDNDVTQDIVDGVYTFTLDNSVTIVATFEAIQFTVTFKDADGNVLSSQTVGYNETATAPETPVKQNTPSTAYEFLGWFAAEAQEAFDFTNVITSDLVLSAKFQARTLYYTVSVNMPEGGSVAVSPAGQHTYNAEVTVRVTASEGYELKSLTVNGVEVSVANDEYKFNVTANTQIVATFQAAEKKGGCGSNLNGGFVGGISIGVIALAAAAAVVLKKKSKTK